MVVFRVSEEGHVQGREHHSTAAEHMHPIFAEAREQQAMRAMQTYIASCAARPSFTPPLSNVEHARRSDVRVEGIASP